MSLIPYTLLYAAVFLINPTIALVMAAFIVIVNPKTRTRDYYMFYLMLACWLGVLNMTKQLFSDQIYYAAIFAHADTSDFWDAVVMYRGSEYISWKEIIFNFYSVVCNILTGANPRAYFFIVTVNIYVLHFLAIHKVLFASRRTKMEVLCAITLMAFFTPFFIQSVHAVRQILATAFIIYAIAYRALERKNLWLFIIIAFFIHNTTIFYIALALLPQIYRIMSYKQISIFLFVFGLFTVSYVQLGMLMEAVDIEGGGIAAVGQRLASGNESGSANIFSLRSLLIYAIPLVGASLLIIMREYKIRKPTPILPFCYLAIITLMLILSFFQMPTVQFRYQFYLYSLFPFVALFPFKRGDDLGKFYCLLITGFFTFRFFFSDVDWSTYASWNEILLNPFYHFLTTQYYLV